MNRIEINRIVRSNRNTIALQVNADAGLVVRAPIKTSLEYINKVVAKKILWIRAKQALVKKNYAKTGSKEFVNGEGFLYLGKSYRLKISDKHKNIILSDFLYLPQGMQTRAKENLVAWYKIKALEKIRERVNWYSNMTGLKCNYIKITDAKKRWGSCTSKGGLCFSWRLIMSSLSVLDYVVVHELAHLEERNHSSKFWSKVRVIMPDYEKKYKWLKENSATLNL
jgi:predicted metal-dependent hydrolase